MDRYWVGGTASWDGTAGTKWSTTSGGGGGASVPTTADDVFFDVLSTGTCTIATGNTGAKSINCTGFTGTITGTAAITVAGSVTLSALMTYTHTGVVTFTGTGTLTTAGKAFSEVSVFASGITLTLGDALNTVGRAVSVFQGTFDTANYSVTAGFLGSQLTNTRTINLGSSTLTLSTASGVTFTDADTLTFNAGTSQINCSNAGAFVQGFGKTFYDVSFTSTSAGGTRTINGANTFNNLTLTASAAGMSQLSLAANQTVNGTFTCAGSLATQRGFVRSDTIGTTRTITCAAVSATDCDFRDITIAGAAAPISPTRGGDCGGNSGITFPAAKTVYRVGTNTNWNTTSWATTSNGTPAINNFPLAQDTAVIDNATTLTGTLALGTAFNIGSIDCSTRTTGITLNHNVAVTRYGSYILGSGVSISGTQTQTFSGRSTMVFTSAGKTIPFDIIVDAPSGTFRLGDAYSASNTITHTRGTFDAFNYNVTCTRFASANTNTRTITMGSGLWTISGTGTGGASAWNLGTNISNLTFNKDTANILLSNTSTTAREFRGSSTGLSFNKLTIGGATGTSVTTITGNSSFTELASTKTVAHTVSISSNLGTIDTWSITGTVGNVVTVNSSTAGSRRTFSLTNVTTGIDYLSVKDIGVNQANRFYVGANSIDGGNNLNVIFTASPGGSVNVDVTGVEAIGSVGIGTVVASARAPPTGVEATGAVGTVVVYLPTQFSVTGVEATGAVGTVLTSSAAQTTLTGVEASGAVGTANATVLQNVRPIGVQGSGEVGTPSFSISVAFPVTGVEATGSVGTVGVSIPKQVSVTGLSAANDIGTVTVESKGQVFLTGVAATGAIGDTQQNSAANVTLTGVGAQGAVDTVTTQSAYYLTGVSATGQIGTVTLVAGCKVFVVGVQAAAVVTTPLVWGVINDNQTPNWVPVNDTQSGNWVQINDGNTVIWTQIPT